MKSDIEIAQEAKMKPIADIAAGLGLAGAEESGEGDPRGAQWKASNEEDEELKKKREDAGAKVEVK